MQQFNKNEVKELIHHVSVSLIDQAGKLGAFDVVFDPIDEMWRDGEITNNDLAPTDKAQFATLDGTIILTINGDAWRDIEMDSLHDFLMAYLHQGECPQVYLDEQHARYGFHGDPGQVL
jgi:hypothetical protein